ncbi:MAG: hypothetical protein LBJ84_04865 [Oscillospiraceae bacterium]|jgi:hypothetical protein|nr:hypothetical protein [Oscillospiraceae bacterium]
MNIWAYIILTALVAHFCEFVLLMFVDRGHDRAAKAMCALVYFPLYALTYPIRAMRTYNNGSAFYAKRGISRWQFLLGKRVRPDEQ